MLHTRHGTIHTPAFMPVGTLASVKGLTPAELEAVGSSALLANAYHLWVGPGADVIRKAGGLHRFMGWKGSILTDSGGFQLLSLGKLTRIEERGARILSPFDQQERMLSPEVAMEIQTQLDSDIAMILDICPPYPCAPDELREATDRTTRWARRALSAPRPEGQAIFGIVQGGIDRALRCRSAQQLADLSFDGYGIGGLSVGEERAKTWPAVETALRWLPPQRPRYLMGVGAPDDILEGIARGIDLFDSVLPTRLGRNGSVFTDRGRLDLHSATLAGRAAPLDAACDCPACVGFPLAYLHHLVRSGQDLGLRLASLHNVRYLTRLAAEARRAIVENRFPWFCRDALRAWPRSLAAAQSP